MVIDTASRPIGFRFWHRDRQTMYPVDNVNTLREVTYYPGADASIDEWNDGPYGDQFDLDDGVLMEFTGLTDRVGKPIWEGDILLWTIDSEWIEYLPDVPVHYFSQVVFRFGMFGHVTQPDVFVNGGAFDPIIDPHSQFTKPTTMQTDKLLVVGNVYQHANLFRMGLFAPVTLRVPFKFNPHN